MLHNIMPIFTFMGASILRQDSLYSFQIITKTIDTIIPPLIQVCVRWERKEGGGEEKEIGKGCVDRRGEGEQTLSSLLCWSLPPPPPPPPLPPSPLLYSPPRSRREAWQGPRPHPPQWMVWFLKFSVPLWTLSLTFRTTED